MINKKEVFRTIISTGICASVLMACNNKSEKRDLENQKGQFAVETEKAKSETQKNQELNAQLQQLISESETLKTELKEKEMIFSRQRSDREHQLSKLNEEIRDASARLNQIEQKIAVIRSEIAKQEMVLSQTRETIAQEKSDLVAEINRVKSELATEKARANSDIEKLKKDTLIALDKEEKSRNEKYAATEKNLAEQLKELETDLKELDAREKSLVSAQKALAQAQETLKIAQEKFANDQLALNEQISKFAADVGAARDFFIKSGNGDVFEKIQANDNFAFRVSLWGFGSVENIETVRQQIINFNTKEGLSSDNAHKAYLPEFKISTGDRSAAIGNKNQTRTMYVKTKKEVSRVDDSFIVTGTAAEIKVLRDSINKNLSEIASTTGNANANMWLIVRPIQQIRVNMKISLYGSSDMSFDRKEKLIVEMTKVRPLNTPIRSLENLNLSKPSSFVLSQNKQNVCDVVGKECISELNSLGLLNHKTSFELISTDGSLEKFEGTYADYFERLIDRSLTKLKLENEIKQAQQNGFEIVVTQRVMPVEKRNWYGGKYTDFETIESKDTSAIDVFLKNKEVLENLASQPVLERIEISYEISMVDIVNGQNDSLDMAKYFQAGTIGDTAIHSLELANRGEIEIKLPIDLEATNTSKSQFSDLTLKGFKPSGLVEPTKPVAQKRYSYTSDESVLVKQVPARVLNLVGKDLKKGRTLNLNAYEQKYHAGIEIFAKKITQDLAVDNYPKALQAYEVAMTAYNDKVYPAKMLEYSNRRQDLMLDLREMLREIKK